MMKKLWKILLFLASLAVVVFIAWINIKYWNEPKAGIPDWASKIMFH